MGNAQFTSCKSQLCPPSGYIDRLINSRVVIEDIVGNAHPTRADYLLTKPCFDFSFHSIRVGG